MIKEYDLLFVCSYYKPYVSGLTSVVTFLAEYFSNNGKKVAVICHKHDPTLPTFTEEQGIAIFRIQPNFHISRGSFSWNYIKKAIQLSRKSKVTNLHLPLPESGLISLCSNSKVVTTYQCDIPKIGLMGSLIGTLMDLVARITFHYSSTVIFSSEDYFIHSRNRRAAAKKVEFVSPFSDPVSKMPGKFRINDFPHFGFLGRFTSEKGIIFLIETYISNAPIDSVLLLAGSTEVAGDSVLQEAINIAKQDSRIQILGNLSAADKEEFYNSIDLFLFPSNNCFEAFGISQLESLKAGVPVVVSDLPGVRSIVREYPFCGEVLPVADKAAWARVFTATPPRKLSRVEIANIETGYQNAKSLEMYQANFEE
jgi:glycosyltransferase involved in cell wall biosynthesis